MFEQINRINRHGEKKVSLIKLEDIAYIHEEHLDPVCLYNADGELVSEEQPKERTFIVVLNTTNQYGQVRYKVDEEEYNKLVEKLTK